MSSRLKVILAVIIGSVAVASQLVVDQASIETADPSSAFVRLGMVFGTPAFAAAVAWMAAYKRRGVTSAWANAFLVVMAIVGGCLVVADIVIVVA